jgi:pyridoxine 5-phosphate synthase
MHQAKNPAQQAGELARIRQAAHYAHRAGLQVNAGHGLNFYNVEAICAIPEIVELNIGHSIIAQALFSGLAQTVKDLKHYELCDKPVSRLFVHLKMNKIRRCANA